MLEIIVLYFLCKSMGEKLRAKGWKQPVWMQIAVVIAWFGCMILGSFAYGIYLVIKEGYATAENLGFSVYPVALMAGASGVGLLFWIAGRLPSKLPPPPLIGEKT